MSNIDKAVKFYEKYSNGYKGVVNPIRIHEYGKMTSSPWGKQRNNANNSINNSMSLTKPKSSNGSITTITKL